MGILAVVVNIVGSESYLCIYFIDTINIPFGWIVVLWCRLTDNFLVPHVWFIGHVP
jgi:hypothetical protein